MPLSIMKVTLARNNKENEKDILSNNSNNTLHSIQ